MQSRPEMRPSQLTNQDNIKDVQSQGRPHDDLMEQEKAMSDKQIYGPSGASAAPWFCLVHQVFSLVRRQIDRFPK